MPIKNFKPAKRKPSVSYKQFVWLFLVFLFVIIAWTINANNVYDENGNNLGTYGDKFGAVNALFSGLAFAGIIFTIMLQRNELAMQREESHDARKEFVQQNFEATFFNLLKNQQSILLRLTGRTEYINQHVTDIQTNVVNGVTFFVLAKRELSRIMKTLEFGYFGLYDHDYFYSISPEPEHPDEVDDDYTLAVHTYTNSYYNITKDMYDRSKNYKKKEFCKLAYIIFFVKNHYNIGHYFRHLYHIFKFLNYSEENEIKDAKDSFEVEEIENKYKSYAQFVQAQMAAPELLLLYYNCIAYQKMKDLVVKYGILENLNIEDLISEDNHVLEGINLRRRRDLFNF
ncbi:Putative phage abortive infection protein [Pedobacter suwonensis]|uniref:Putative phage abortive infection protein n=1 Tax=Pedobacter suwonensis TaxID=332999 RepID=A0A1I0TEM8_9SPHI|nr:putative phage abortive infection protein [Pedobacter suwonensis]SFA50199.1 Putative phage abortive infection protein [Pedobacter suwonensis]